MADWKFLLKPGGNMEDYKALLQQLGFDGDGLNSVRCQKLMELQLGVLDRITKHVEQQPKVRNSE